MKIDAKYQPEKTASKDTTRPHFCQAFLDAEDPKVPVMVTTDGHALSIVPVELEDGDVTGPVPLAALKAARENEKLRTKANPDKGKLCMTANGVVAIGDGREYPRGDDRFPPWRQVVPGDDDVVTLTIGVNLLLLADACAAIGVRKGEKPPFVKLTFRGPIDPIVIEANGAKAVVMPWPV